MGIKLSLVGCFVAAWSIPAYLSSPKVEEMLQGEAFLEIPRSNFNVTDILDRMSMGHTYKGDPRMSSGVLAAYLVSFYGMWLLHKEYNWFIIQRHRYLRRKAPQNYAMYVHRIPSTLRSKTALREYFSVLFDDILEINLLRNIPQLEKLCAKRDKLSSEAKHSEALLEKLRAEKPSLLSPPLLWQLHKAREGAVEEKLSRDRALLAETNAKISARKAELEAEWEAHEAAAARGERVGAPGSVRDAAFVTFKSLKSATCARQLALHELPHRLVAEEAPVPSHVIWGNCGLHAYRREGGQVLAMAVTCAICIFWVIPVTFVATLQKVDELKKVGPPGCQAAGSCPLMVAAEAFPLLDEVLAVLAPYLLIGLNYTLPVVLWYVCALEGHVGMDTFHASLFSKLTLFMIVQTFFVSAIAGTLLAELSSLVQEPLVKLQHILASSLPAQAVTFMGLIFVKCSYRLMMELLRPRSALQGWIRTWVGPRLTPEERAQDYYGLSPLIWVLRPYSSPGPLKYHILLPDLVLMFTVLFVYSVLSPIANLLLLPAFAFLNVAYRHQMIYVYDPSNDTGGQLWPQLANYLLVSLVIAQVTVLGVLSLNESPGATLLLPLLACTLLFARYMRRHHPRIAHALPLFNCDHADRQRLLDDKGLPFHFLHDKYTQPALRSPPPSDASAPDNDEEAASTAPAGSPHDAPSEPRKPSPSPPLSRSVSLRLSPGPGQCQWRGGVVAGSLREGSVEASLGTVHLRSLSPQPYTPSASAPLRPPPLQLRPAACLRASSEAPSRSDSTPTLSASPLAYSGSFGGNGLVPAPRLLYGSDVPSVSSPEHAAGARARLLSVEVPTVQFSVFGPAGPAGAVLRHP